jgi:hypothetical protein
VHNAVHVQWLSSGNDGGNPIKEYVIAAEPLHGFGPRIEHSCSGLPLAGGLNAGWLKGLSGDAEYVVCVYAVNLHGFSEASPPSAPFRSTAVAPVAPQNPRVTQLSRDRIGLAWDEPINSGDCHAMLTSMMQLATPGGSPVLRYQVQAVPQRRGLQPVGVTVEGSTSVFMTGLIGNQKYVITILAENKQGASGPRDSEALRRSP